jgi:hypothetical protein
LWWWQEWKLPLPRSPPRPRRGRAVTTAVAFAKLAAHLAFPQAEKRAGLTCLCKHVSKPITCFLSSLPFLSSMQGKMTSTSDQDHKRPSVIHSILKVVHYLRFSSVAWPFLSFCRRHLFHLTGSVRWFQRAPHVGPVRPGAFGSGRCTGGLGFECDCQTRSSRHDRCPCRRHRRLGRAKEGGGSLHRHRRSPFELQD